MAADAGCLGLLAVHVDLKPDPRRPAHLDALRADMRKAAENLEFEEAARLRDEIHRLEAVELAVADDPLARQSAVEAASEAKVKGRSTAGKPGQRAGKKRGR